MEETLTECLIKVREDLRKLNNVWDFSDANSTEENFKFTRRTTEPFNSILAVCPSQNTPETDALEMVLDNFYHLVSSNKDSDVWTTFDHELSIICAKFLSVIERTETFEVLFSKLLTIINEVSENDSNIWKATARQILNVFINKKFSPGYFDAILKIYTVTLRNIDELSLHNFFLQNLHLLKTLSMLVQRVGDFETQFAIMRVVFLHLSRDPKLMTDFFAMSEEDKVLFQSLTFADFDEDCRLYLNALNKHLGGCERKVYSISCHVLSLGGCVVEPLMDRKVIWVDANKETERISIKCAGFDLEDQRVIHLRFSEITHVQIESEKTDGSICVTIQTKNLRHLHCDIENDDICLFAENRKDVSEFVTFLESAIKNKKGKFSKTEPLLIDRSLLGREGLQVNAISSSARPEVDPILSDIISLFGKPEEENIVPQTQIKTPPLSSQERKIVLETPDSPSFLATTAVSQMFEDLTETVKFLQSKTHKLMGSQEKFFLEPIEELLCFVFDKENKPPGKQKTYNRKTKPPGDVPPSQRVLRVRKQHEATSQDCFRQNVQPKKPSMPKFNRKKTQKNQPEVENKKKQPNIENKKKQPRRTRRYKPLPIQGVEEQSKPSLLDPNGYGFRRWLQPTTSERSNFWLRKLDERNKQKADVFEFSESDFEVVRKPKRRIVTSRLRYKRQKYDTKRPPLKEMDFLKNVKKPSIEVKKPCPVVSPKPTKPEDVLINSPDPSQSSPKWKEHIKSDIAIRCSTTPELSSEDEPPETQKRDRSEEENSLTRVHLKKKTKTKLLPPEMFLPMIRRRLQKAEDKARQQTNEIIATMNKATHQLLNHFYRKEGTKITSYLKVAEQASMAFETDVEDLQRRAKRLHRVIVYFEAGCSVSELYQSMENHFTKIRDGFKNMETMTDGEEKINHVTGRLKSLIESGIDRSIKNEMTSRRNQLLRCASILGTEFR